jgi:hypothetical protein
LLQRVSSFVQPPVHKPPLQATAQALPMFCHCLVPSHVCGCSPLHWVASGMQPGSSTGASPVVSGEPSRPVSGATSLAVSAASAPSFPPPSPPALG